MKHTFRNINHLPSEEGILFSGISMNRIGNRQSAQNWFDDLTRLYAKVKKTEGIGVVTLYSDYLYLHSDERASVLRNRCKDLMFSHKNGFMRLVAKNPLWTKKAFSFSTFGQIMVDNSMVFESALRKIIALYKTDRMFQDSVQFDVANVAHGFGENEIMFILEEITFLYLAMKGTLAFNNQLVVRGTEKWMLQCYPGKPLKSEVHLFQKNPLKLSNSKNKYENSFYDLESKVLYDYTKIDIDTFDFYEH